MRVATIVVCVLVAGAFVAFGFWWKANVQADSADTRSPQPDEPTRSANNGTGPARIQDDSPTPPSQPPVAANAPDERPAPGDGAVSDENRRLQEMLASSDDNARREALLALGALDDTDPALLTDTLAEDPSPVIRAAAAQGLSRLKRREVIPQLLDALDDEDLNVRTWAITALNNTLHGVRFPYRADEPRERRLYHISVIRTNLTTWGVLGENTDAEGGR